jgi:hypothetical protein
MDEETRQQVKRDLQEEGAYELRTMVEVGSPLWRTFMTSAGDDYACPHCGAQGSVLVEVADNRFVATVLYLK